MILAISFYLAGFGLTWSSLALAGTHESFWTIPMLICPLAWIIGMMLRLPCLLVFGLYGAVGLATWAAFSGAFLAALGAMVLAFLAWDAASFALRLADADKVPNRTELWQALLLRSSGLGLMGAAMAVGFAQLKLSLPFWGLVGLLLAAWGALAALRQVTAHHQRSDKQESSDSFGPLF